ncbi:MerR family transcriptional regulator [Aquicoccus sp. SU-CL01552]|uniref:MerR family transcriptional regulator n=1 Tax=Aquicoccus sp. SU-CL01552 TaxID=3127656 RepID=UPI00310964ED
MAKSPDAFRTISEVAAWLGVQAHVLRFWESKFSQVRPVKRAGGRRYYRPSDMRLIGGIKTLLHDDGMTIKGVQKILREQGVAHVSALSPALEGEADDSLEAVVESGGTVLAFKAKDAPSTEVSGTVGSQPEQTDTPDHDAAADDAPPASTLPSFLSRPPETTPDMARPTPPTPVTPVPVTPAPVAAAPGTGAPLEADLPYTPGVLGHLAGVTVLSPDQANRIAPLARALRDWHDRHAKAGWG